MAIFTLDEAEALMPVVQELTAEAVRRVQHLSEQLEKAGDAERAQVQEEARKIIEAWAQRIVDLGADVKGLWLVDFDNGKGYYCWKHPEPSLEYFHTYAEGFAGRRAIEGRVLH